eukprot:c3248_g1_i1.p1 GENE.c3248_g1_i1~~c3248_g1_i1.p1  ORF type:complete len:186 (+),score=24.96 c3248_g1_i1:51-608(+)
MLVSPGQRIGGVAEFAAGDGTYVRDNHVYSCRAGSVVIGGTPAGQKMVQVLRNKAQSFVPSIGDIVTGKVTKVSRRVMNMTIMCVGSKTLRDDFNGIVRVENVRPHDIDKVEMYKCFRPGDVVRAEVISLGDSRSYVLSTAKAELGVVFAQSLAGETMQPVNHEQMRCPLTNTIEHRKVAKTVEN